MEKFQNLIKHTDVQDVYVGTSVDDPGNPVGGSAKKKKKAMNRRESQGKDMDVIINSLYEDIEYFLLELCQYFRRVAAS